MQKTINPKHNIVYHFHYESVGICFERQLVWYCPYSFFDCSNESFNRQYAFISAGYIEIDVHIRKEFFYMLKLPIAMYVLTLNLRLGYIWSTCLIDLAIFVAFSFL